MYILSFITDYKAVRNNYRSSLTRWGSSESGGGDSSQTSVTTTTVGRGRLVQKGIHRYIELDNGKTISISEYDTFSGMAKDYNGNTYEANGGGIHYE